MNVLFIIPPDSEVKDNKQIGSIFPRIGVAYIVSYLRQHSIDVGILDCKGEKIKYDEIRKRILSYNPDIVALTAFTEEIYEAVKVCKICKEININIITVIGGPHASAIPERTLSEFPVIDVVVYGEGEQTLLEIAELNGRKLDNVDGIAYRNEKHNIILNKSRENIKDIDSIPFPAWDLFSLDNYRGILTDKLNEKINSNVLELPILSARGCPYKCNFCYKVYGTTLRLRNPAKIVDEIEYDIKRYKANQFFFVEGTFGINKTWGVELCNEIIKRGLNNKIKWVAETRVDATEELLIKMKEAGCILVGFGVESGDSKIFENSGKGISMNQVRSAIGISKKLGFIVECFFIIGHPYETKESINKTIDFAEELDPDIFNLGIMIPYPGTEIQAMAEKGIGNYVLLSQNWSEYTKQRGGTLELKDISIDDLRKIQSRAYLRFYIRPRRIIKMLKTLPISKLLKISVSVLKGI